MGRSRWPGEGRTGGCGSGALEGQEALGDGHVLDMDGQARVVRDPAHQLVGEEQGDERDPVPEEEPASPEDDRRQAERHRQDIRRERHPALEHDHDERGITEHGTVRGGRSPAKSGTVRIGLGRGWPSLWPPR